MRLKKDFEEYEITEPSTQVSVAPGSRTFDEALASLDRHQKMLEDRGHVSVRIDKVTKHRVVKEKHMLKPNAYDLEILNRTPVAICRIENKKFVCDQYTEGNSI